MIKSDYERTDQEAVIAIYNVARDALMNFRGIDQRALDTLVEIRNIAQANLPEEIDEPVEEGEVSEDSSDAEDVLG